MDKKIIIITLSLMLFLAACNNVVETPDDVVLSNEKQELFDRLSANDAYIYGVDWKIESSRGNETTTAELKQFIFANNTRTDTVVQGNLIREYNLNGEIISCRNTDEWECVRLQPRPVVNLKETFSDPKFVVEKIESRVVSDWETNCFKITNEESSAEYCFNEQNIPVYISQGTNVSITLTAVNLVLDINETVFELPTDIGRK